MTEAETALAQATRDVDGALTRPGTPVTAVREYVRRFQRAWNAASQTPRLRVDGDYGTNTRAALARALGVPVAEAPDVRTRTATPPTPARRTTRETTTAEPETAPGEIPEWVSKGVALAKWTTQARAADSTANHYLRNLNQNAVWLAARTDSSMAGVEVGYVPETPSDSQIEQWARAAWDRAQREGEPARRALQQHADGIIASGQRALTEVRRALESEARAATSDLESAAMRAIEETLTAILRPAARAVRASGIGTPLVLIGAGLLLLSLGSRKAA
jgi:hypothetical protein